MHHSLRTTLAAALLFAAATSGRALAAEPVKVTLPKGAPPKAREQPVEISPDEPKGPDRRALRNKGRFQLDFDKVDIDKLVQTISDMTGKLFILPENIRGKISIVGPEHGKAGVTADEAYQAFLSALDANGLTLYPAGRYMKIVEKRTGKQSNIKTVLDGEPYTTNEEMLTKLFRLKYVEAEPVRAVIQQLVSRDGDTIAFPPSSIIVNDIGLNMHRLEKIIEQLDQPASSDEMRVIQVQFATANDVAEKLRQIFDQKQNKGASAAGPKGGPRLKASSGPEAAANAGAESAATLSQIIADERTNKLIVMASEAAFERIDLLLKQLDTPIPGEGQVHVYYLENANAEELASTLSSLTQGTANRAARPPTPAGGAKGGSPVVADLFSGEIKITAEKGTNSLVIIASNTDYKNLVKVIEQLDIARRQVFVEAVIMEVNLSNNNDFGISLHGGAPVSAQETDDSIAVLGSQVGNARSLGGVLSLAQLGGFLAGLQGPYLEALTGIPSFSVVLQALQKSSDVNVLSTPHILTSDNEEAEISVGQNVPFQTGVTSSLTSALSGLTSGASANTSALATSMLGSYGGLVSGIQRTNVELKLKIKPQINESDYIRLQIEEQTEEIAERDAQLGPTTAKRAAKTTIVARDQQTVVIGGLIQERTVSSVEKTPVLGDIPVVGRLFRSTSKQKTKTNLLLFLTPYIVRDQADFRRIFERKLKERQEFVEQFYGRQPGYNVPIDYNRKAGPLSSMFRDLAAESQKAENGGPGSEDEKLIIPSSRPTSDGEAAEAVPASAGPDAPVPGNAAPALEAAPEVQAPPPPPPEVQEPPDRPD